MEMEFRESSAIRGQNESMKLPLGVRFDPDPRELVFYVKVKNFDLTPTIEIPEVDVYKIHPKRLTTEIDSSFGIYGNGRSYYFTKRKRKAQGGSRVIRSMNEGYWKTTSKDKDVTDDTNKKIGYHKTFKFFEFEGDDKKPTNWIMHEFRDLNTKSVMEMDSVMDASTSNENSDRIEHYVLCMIYEKGKECPTNYPPSTQAILNTGVDAEEVRESSIPQNQSNASHPHEANSLMPNMDQFPLPLEFLDHKVPGHLIEPDGENMHLNFPDTNPSHPHEADSMSCDPSGNLNPPESIRSNPGPPDYSNGFSMSHDLSRNLNPLESTLLVPRHPFYNNEFPMFDGISNEFSMSHDLSRNLNPPESTLLIPGRPCYSNEFPMCGGISNDFSMSCDLSGNLNPPESTLLIPDRPCYNNELPMFDGISNEFSMSQDLSRNLNAPDGEESPLDCCSHLWHGNLCDKIEY